MLPGASGVGQGRSLLVWRFSVSPEPSETLKILQTRLLEEAGFLAIQKIRGAKSRAPRQLSASRLYVRRGLLAGDYFKVALGFQPDGCAAIAGARRVVDEFG